MALDWKFRFFLRDEHANYCEGLVCLRFDFFGCRSGMGYCFLHASHCFVFSLWRRNSRQVLEEENHSLCTGYELYRNSDYGGDHNYGTGQFLGFYVGWPFQWHGLGSLNAS